MQARNVENDMFEQFGLRKYESPGSHEISRNDSLCTSMNQGGILKTTEGFLIARLEIMSWGYQSHGRRASAMPQQKCQKRCSQLLIWIGTTDVYQ